MKKSSPAAEASFAGPAAASEAVAAATVAKLKHPAHQGKMSKSCCISAL